MTQQVWAEPDPSCNIQTMVNRIFARMRSSQPHRACTSPAAIILRYNSIDLVAVNNVNKRYLSMQLISKLQSRQANQLLLSQNA